METGTILLGMAVFALLVFVLIGGPAALTDRLRRRSAEATRRQIAITDAIDSQLGPIVSPVVKNPLWGPWEVQIAVPVARLGAAGTILKMVDEVLTGPNYTGVDRYRIVLTPKQSPIREGRERETRSGRPAVRWSRDTKVTA